MYFLASFYTFVAIFYALIINRHQKAAKSTTFLHVGSRYSLHWWNHITFRVFRVMIWAICVLRIPFSNVDHAIGLFEWSSPYPYIMGMTLLLLGFTVAIATNLHMNNAWRSGIDINNTSSLVTDGFYSRSRNPAFLGVAGAQLGFFLALPSAFSLICLCIGLLTLRLQTMLEERHLQQHFGSLYLRYRHDVPRWL